MKPPLVCALLILGSLSAQAYPAIGKWARYGGPGDAIDTELHGTVKWITGNDLFITPDPSYEHLLITGNRIKPAPDEYNASWYPGLDTNFTPVLKLETYGVSAARPETNPSGAPISVLLPDGTRRLLQVGDHISVTGLWVIDYAHTMYSGDCTHSFSYTRGTYAACRAHAEIHPFNIDSVKIIPTLFPVGSTVIEKHLIAAPIYEDYYTPTYWNMLSGIANDLVDQSIWIDWTKNGLVQPPLAPFSCYSCTTQLALSSTGPYGSVNWTANADQSINLHMTVHGTDILNPSIFVTNASVVVQDCNLGACSCLPTPRCIDYPLSGFFVPTRLSIAVADASSLHLSPAHVRA